MATVLPKSSVTDTEPPKVKGVTDNCQEANTPTTTTAKMAPPIRSFCKFSLFAQLDGLSIQAFISKSYKNFARRSNAVENPTRNRPARDYKP